MVGVLCVVICNRDTHFLSHFSSWNTKLSSLGRYETRTKRRSSMGVIIRWIPFGPWTLRWCGFVILLTCQILRSSVGVSFKIPCKFSPRELDTFVESFSWSVSLHYPSERESSEIRTHPFTHFHDGFCSVRHKSGILRLQLSGRCDIDCCTLSLTISWCLLNEVLLERGFACSSGNRPKTRKVVVLNWAQSGLSYWRLHIFKNVKISWAPFRLVSTFLSNSSVLVMDDVVIDTRNNFILPEASPTLFIDLTAPTPLMTSKLTLLRKINLPTLVFLL